MVGKHEEKVKPLIFYERLLEKSTEEKEEEVEIIREKETCSPNLINYSHKSMLLH